MAVNDEQRSSRPLDSDAAAQSGPQASSSEGAEREGTDASKDAAGPAGSTRQEPERDAGATSGAGASSSGAGSSGAGSSLASSSLARRAHTPSWVVPVYVLGLVLVYIGERVLVEMETGGWVCTLVGVVGLIAATAARFNPSWRSGGERGRIENLLGVLSVLGMAGVALYFAGTEAGLEKLGFASAAMETRERVETLVQIGWICLIAVSVLPMVFAEIALHPMREAEHLEARRVQAATASGLVFAFAAIYTSLFVYAASDAEVQADYSFFKTSEPGSSTRKLLEHTSDSIKITAFFPEVSDVRPEVGAYFRRLTEGLDNVEFRLVDRYLEPKLAQELRAINDGMVIFQREEQRQSITLDTELGKAREKLKTLDQLVNERLTKILRVRRSLYITVGHGEVFEKAPEGEQEREGKIFRELAERLNYRVKNLGVAEGLAGDVPDDATIVAVVGPTEPFAPEEIASLKRFVDGGGKLLLALDADSFSSRLQAEEAGASPTANPATGSEPPPIGSAAVDAPDAPADDAAEAAGDDSADNEASEAKPKSPLEQSLSELAGLVGLTYDARVLANEQRHVKRRNNASDHILLPSNRFSSHSSVSTVGKRRNGVLLAGAGALDRIKDGGSAKANFALRTLPDTFADTNGNFKKDPDEKISSFNLVAAVTDDSKKLPQPPEEEEKGRDDRVDPTPREMRAFVIADADALTDVVMSRFLENQLFIYDALRWMGGEESLAGTINTEEDVRIEHTKQKDLVWFYSTIVGIPVLVFVAGFTFSRRLKKKGSK